MPDPTENVPEQLSSDEIIPRHQVAGIDDLKAKWALILSGCALLIGVVFLITAICMKDAELRTWSTGLISLVVGAALGFAFSNSNNNQG